MAEAWAGVPPKDGPFVSICLFIVRLRALRTTLGHQLPWGNILGHMVPSPYTWGHSPKCSAWRIRGPSCGNRMVLTLRAGQSGDRTCHQGQVPCHSFTHHAELRLPIRNNVGNSRFASPVVDNMRVHHGCTARGCVPGRILGAFSREAQGCLGVQPPQSSAQRSGNNREGAGPRCSPQSAGTGEQSMATAPCLPDMLAQ